MKKRVFAIFLAVLMMLPLSIYAPLAEDTRTVAWNVPAIPADAGENINLSSFIVQFAVDKKPCSVTWFLGDKEITSFTADKAGVTELTAKAGDETKTVYVVAKNKDDKEYVLYYNDFDDENSISDWVYGSGMTDRVSVENSNLIIDGRNMDLARFNLPDWLGQFGNYSITAEVTSTEERDTARYNSIVYRSKGVSYPFYHMCVRKNCAASNGVEFAIRTPSNTWDVRNTGSFTENQKTGTYYTYNVQVKDNTILHSINGKAILVNEDKKDYQVGNIGLLANFSVMHVDSIKVALQLTTPEIKIDPVITITSATVENIKNSFTNVAEITEIADFDNLSGAASAILYTDGTNITSPDGSTVFGALNDTFTLIGDTVLPIFYCKNNSAVNGVTRLYHDIGITDASIMSSSKSVIKYARNRNKNLRGIIDFRGRFTDTLTHEDVVAIRNEVNASNCKVALIEASVLDRESMYGLNSLLITPWVYSNCKNTDAAVKAILLGGYGVVSPAPETVKAAYSFFDENTISRTPLLIGHRGNPTNAPENSISSYRLAYENGADVIETDVYLSKDGEIVVMHDADISRTTTGEGNIEKLTLEEIKKANLWGDNDKFKNIFPDEKIPTLREVFEFMQGKDLLLFIEIKSGQSVICNKIANLIKEMNMSERVCIIAFGMNQCVNMHNIAPEISCGYLCSAGDSSTSNIAHNSLYNLMNSVVVNNTTINPSYGNISNKLIDAANDRGITIWTWTYSVSTAERFAYAFHEGIGGITTNDAQYTKNTVREIYADFKDTVLQVGKETDYTVSSLTYGRETSVITQKVTPIVITDNGVVSFENGKLKALKAGKANVTFKCEYSLPINNASYKYTLYTDVVTITVKPDKELDSIVADEDAEFITDGTFIRNLMPGVKLNRFASQFCNISLKFCKPDGTELNENDIVSTGVVVKLVIGDKTLTQKVVIVGDLNGDGVVDNNDCRRLASCVVRSEADASVYEAGKLDGDDMPNVTDHIKLILEVNK